MKKDFFLNGFAAIAIVGMALSACTDNERIRIFYQGGGKVFSRCVNHFIRYLFNSFFYKRYFVVDNYFHGTFVYVGKVKNNS